MHNTLKSPELLVSVFNDIHLFSFMLVLRLKQLLIKKHIQESHFQTCGLTFLMVLSQQVVQQDWSLQQRLLCNNRNHTNLNHSAQSLHFKTCLFTLLLNYDAKIPGSFYYKPPHEARRAEALPRQGQRGRFICIFRHF